jgi:pilus assembly protein CpaB
MKQNKNIIIIVALVSAFLATAFVYSAMKKYEAKVLEENTKSALLYAAKEELSIGTKITEDMLQKIEWPAKKLLPGHIRKKEQVVGKFVKTTVPVGMPVMKELLVEDEGDLSYFIPKDMRAMTLHFGGNTSDVALVRPGSHVDILATFDNYEEEVYTKTILRYVEIIAVNGKTADNFDENAVKRISSVTVLISPDDTEKLTLAKSQAKLQIVLRNKSDLGDGGLHKDGTVFAHKRKTVHDYSEVDDFQPEPSSPGAKVKVIRGAEVQNVPLT